jgi:hypothetical protein
MDDLVPDQLDQGIVEAMKALLKKVESGELYFPSVRE